MRYCTKCNKKYSDTVDYCPHCGRPLTNVTKKQCENAENEMLIPINTDITTKKDDYNILSIIGFFMVFIVPPLGLVFCILALKYANRYEEKLNDFAVPGIVLSIVIMIFMVVAALIFSEKIRNIVFSIV